MPMSGTIVDISGPGKVAGVSLPMYVWKILL